MGVVYFSIIPTFEPSRYCKCWIVCFYNKFIRSYKFTFWFQLIGVLAGFIVPSVVLLIIFKEFIYCAFGATIGIFWMCVWMMLSMVIPPTRIYRKFAKWYRKSDVSIRDLDEIFY